jgi:hypothetical protein
MLCPVPFPSAPRLELEAQVRQNTRLSLGGGRRVEDAAGDFAEVLGGFDRESDQKIAHCSIRPPTPAPHPIKRFAVFPGCAAFVDK